MIRSIISVFALGSFFISIFHMGFTLCIKAYLAIVNHSSINYTISNFKEALFIGVTVGGGTALLNCLWILKNYKKR